jgi:hypothetical protein
MYIAKPQAKLSPMPAQTSVMWRSDWTVSRREGRRSDGSSAVHWATYVRSEGIGASREQMIAVHVLTHESMHLSGVRNEAESECRAMQRDAWMARLLGAARSDARYLASWYWRTIYPNMSPGHRSDDCVPGQAFDAGLPDPPWGTAE